METKISIRKAVLTARNALTKEEQNQKSKIISEKTANLESVEKADTVLCYAGYKSEVLTNSLIQNLLERGKKVYLPKVSNDDMEFQRIYRQDDLVNGYMNIPEPGDHCTETFLPQMLSQYGDRVVMILPGCAFSPNGERIGYGKGYYDRYLMRIPCKERIALCYELQLVDKIPVDIHDIPMTRIVTEQRIICI